jgi:hypothetical protein
MFILSILCDHIFYQIVSYIRIFWIWFQQVKNSHVSRQRINSKTFKMTLKNPNLLKYFNLKLVYHDGIYFILFFAYGIAAATNETYLRNYWYFDYNPGAMGMGSFSAFMCAILCGIDIYLILKARSKNQSPLGTNLVGQQQNPNNNNNNDFSDLRNGN